MKGGVIMKELSTTEVRVLNNVSQAIDTSVKLGDLLQTMIREQVILEEQTPVIPEDNTPES